MAFESIVDGMTPGGERLGLVTALAVSRPDLVLYRATAWLTGNDAGVLLALCQHWYRVALAGALRPWTPAAVDVVVDGGGDQIDIDLITRVMADTAPAVTRPHGIEDRPGRRWYAIAGEPWEWSLWRCSDGRHALEVVVHRELIDFAVSEPVDVQLVTAWRRDGPAALDETIGRIRAQA